MEGPEIPGPKIWKELSRKSEAKIIGHLKKLEVKSSPYTCVKGINKFAFKERSSWMKGYLAQAKVKMGKVCPEPEFVPKVTIQISFAGPVTFIPL